MTEKVTIIGAERDDQGPKGLLVRYIEAAVAKDAETFAACLAANSREMIGVDQMALEGNTVTIGDVAEEGEYFVVPTIAADEHSSDEMNFMVREEDGELRVDMQATMERAMGMSRDDLVDQVVETVADSMESVAAGMTEVFSKGLESADEALGKSVDLSSETLAYGQEDLVQGQWVLSQEALSAFPEHLLTAAYAVGKFMTPPFSPAMTELETEEYGTDASQVKTSRYGEEHQGFTVTENLTSGEGFSTHSVTVNAFGMAEGHEISSVWVRYTSGDTVTENVTIQASASQESLQEVERFLAEEIGIQG